jgi:hypothetical protein
MTSKPRVATDPLPRANIPLSAIPSALGNGRLGIDRLDAASSIAIAAVAAT